MTSTSDNRNKSENLFSLDGHWKFLPIALIMCAAEIILAGINLLSSPPDAAFGLPLILLGSIIAISGIAILLTSTK